MKLTVGQCLELIKSPVSTSYIYMAQKQEERLIMHCEPLQDKADAPASFIEFLNWVQSFLPKDKFDRFSQLVTFPLETVDSTEVIFDELSKFLNAPDRNIRYEFSNAAYEDDFTKYIKETIEPNFWENKGMDALRVGINSLIVIDTKPNQSTLRPEPYFYFLNIKALFDIQVNKMDGEIEYVIFWQKDGSLIVIDEIAYRRFIKPNEASDWQLAPDGEKIHSVYSQSNDQKGNIVYGDLISGLGYTPVCSFWKPAIKGSEGINKKGVITSSLTKLDWLLFFKTSKKYLDLYGAWPIIVSYKETCDYRDEQGNPCEEGYINYSYPDSSDPERLIKAQRECPACKSRGVIGAGSFWTVDPPKDKDDVDLMLNPVKFVEISNDKLEYAVSEIDRLENEIFENTVGFVQEATTSAINEKQVVSQYEGQKAVLDKIREQFERSQQFAMETVARLRYGTLFVRSTVFLGKEYFLQTPDDITVQYQNAKKAGLPYYEISRIRETYSKTKFKDEPGEYQRSYILSQLEPYPDQSLAELRNYSVDQQDQLNFYLKLDFANFIAKFEREQMNIVEFGSLIPFKDKISIIQTKLLEYVREKNLASPQLNQGGSASPQA